MPDQPRKASLLIVFLIVFIDLLGFGMVLPLLPIYADQFVIDVSGLTIGLLMSSFSAMQFLFAPMWGRLSDRIGRRPVLMIGLAGSVAFYFLFGIASILQSLNLLFISRIGAGIAGATISTAHAYIADATSLENRAKGMALIGAAFGLGFTFGPLFGALAVPLEVGPLPPIPGPGPGYAAAALSAVALVLAYFKLPESLKPGSAPAARNWIDTRTFSEALAMPSVGLLLLTSFVCVFSFANFESTLSLMIMKDRGGTFDFSLREVCWTFAFIGFTLTLVQGGIVRRLSGRIHEGVMAASGAVLEIIGFGLLIEAGHRGTLPWLLTALAVVVSGFACMTPSLNSLISRRSDPTRQGAILGVAQSISALARICGPMAGIPLFRQQASLPLWLAAGLMAIGLLLVVIAARGGRDFRTA
jgi:DHA1 family tetracycline resistance protein-like MFS transporter